MTTNYHSLSAILNDDLKHRARHGIRSKAWPNTTANTGVFTSGKSAQPQPERANLLPQLLLPQTQPPQPERANLLPQPEPTATARKATQEGIDTPTHTADLKKTQLMENIETLYTTRGIHATRAILTIEAIVKSLNEFREVFEMTTPENLDFLKNLTSNFTTESLDRDFVNMFREKRLKRCYSIYHENRKCPPPPKLYRNGCVPPSLKRSISC